MFFFFFHPIASHLLFFIFHFFHLRFPILFFFFFSVVLADAKTLRNCTKVPTVKRKIFFYETLILGPQWTREMAHLRVTPLSCFIIFVFSWEKCLLFFFFDAITLS